MADPFVAEIRIFPFNFPPKGWAWCDGQLMPISQNTALFSLLGTTYGGDGKSNFALPNMQGNAPMHPGQGPGLSLHDLGETGGSETVTLLESEIPAHSHNLMATSSTSSKPSPAGNSFARVSGATPYLAPAGAALAQMSDQTIAPAGGDQPHNNMMPYLTLYFNIALQGVFPPRT
ncbi:MAG TPA: tail fiber protein [Bryobacteraceae bacterium]|nr:tail fiber protein [Bryobacteraceae bacterium]